MWPCGWCLKMACPTDPPVGTSGATTGYLFLLQPYRIGWRRGEKKAQEHMGGAFLEWALEAFSGYAAVDELYEGPYCVLSAVDNRHYKRVLYEVAKERERLARSKPKVKRGRPSSKDHAARRRARKSKSIQQKISDLFQDRLLFVKRQVKPSERKRLLHMTRGLPHLRKLREIMEHMYALFDRRCRTQTALD